MSDSKKNITQGVPVKEVCILAAYNKKAIVGCGSDTGVVCITPVSKPEED